MAQRSLFAADALRPPFAAARRGDQIPVFLTLEETLQAGAIGMRRHYPMIKRQSTHGVKRGRGWDEDIEGACAEYAVAKALEVPYEGHVGQGKKANVGGLHVQSTGYWDGCLIVRPSAPQKPHLLIVGAIPDFLVVGWLYFDEAIRADRLHNPHERDEAWWVEQHDLRRMADLPADLRRDPYGSGRR